MSVANKLLQAAAGGGSDPVYVDDLFSTFLYTGNNSGQSIVNGIDLSGEGGLVWLAGRSNSIDQQLYDTERGVRKPIYSNRTDAEGAPASGYALTTFNNNGFTLGTNWNTENYSPYTYCSWTFRKQEKFFDIVTYTGNGSNRTIAHNLGSVPGMIIVKRTDTTGDWQVYHRGNTGSPETDYLVLNSTAATADSNTRWNDTAPTNAVFSVGTEATVNASSGTYVAYLFAHDEQEFGENSDEAIIKCGSYSGNSAGSATTDQTITLGFEPQWIMIRKYSGGIGSWSCFDNMRGVHADGPDNELRLNATTVEQTTDENLRFEADGFTLEGSNLNYTDGSTAHEYLYVAIARSHKPASEFAATALHTTASARSTSAGAPPWWYSGFPVDMAFWKNWGGVGSHQLLDRLRGPKALFPNNDDAEEDRAAAKFDYQDGHYNNDGTQADYHSSMFRRAKGFFDVVAYTGNSTNGRTVTHNLGAVPEMIWVKQRGQAENWIVYNSASGNTKVLRLNSTTGEYTDTPWNDTTPTSTVFSLDNSNTVNGSGRTYIAYLFATVAGISKVGNYTGTGNNVSVDCGFSAGARFILIHRTDASGGWYLFNSNAGIVSGNDPYVLLNTTDAEVSNTDYVDSESAGFRVTSSAPAGLNASGGNYIFLAVA